MASCVFPQEFVVFWGIVARLHVGCCKKSKEFLGNLEILENWPRKLQDFPGILSDFPRNLEVFGGLWQNCMSDVQETPGICGKLRDVGGIS